MGALSSSRMISPAPPVAVHSPVRWRREAPPCSGPTSLLLTESAKTSRPSFQDLRLGGNQRGSAARYFSAPTTSSRLPVLLLRSGSIATACLPIEQRSLS